MEDLQEKQQLYQRLLKYPPFYTLQDHQETRAKQITQWSEIIHSQFKRERKIQSSVSEITDCPVFQDNSTGIPKRMTKDEIREILDHMVELQLIEWTGQENFTINLTSPFELADAIYLWAKEMKLIGYSETMKAISNGELTNQKLKFKDLPEQQILRACEILEQTGRAELYDFDGSYSIKFK